MKPVIFVISSEVQKFGVVKLLILGGQKACLLPYSSKNENAKSGINFLPGPGFRCTWRG